MGMAQLIASGSSDVDYATVNKGLEMSGNHRLALMAGPFHLLPDCRLPRAAVTWARPTVVGRTASERSLEAQTGCQGNG